MNNNGHIIAIGGGGFGRNPNKPVIEEYMLLVSDQSLYFFESCFIMSVQVISCFAYAYGEKFFLNKINKLFYYW